jgi:hypothetical protein
VVRELEFLVPRVRRAIGSLYRTGENEEEPQGKGSEKEASNTGEAGHFFALLRVRGFDSR